VYMTWLKAVHSELIYFCPRMRTICYRHRHRLRRFRTKICRSEAGHCHDL